MSLLGIAIDKSRAAERSSKPYGFIEGSTDEQLLKDIGAIVLEKGSWKPKYKAIDIAEFLNWIAEGERVGPLPTLAKRLLCLKREKLARGIKDAGTADYARAYEKKWIAEIDTIFANAGEKIECVVDFLKTKCETPVPSAASAASAPSVAPSKAPSKAPSVAPSKAPSGAPSTDSSVKDEGSAPPLPNLPPNPLVVESVVEKPVIDAPVNALPEKPAGMPVETQENPFEVVMRFMLSMFDAQEANPDEQNKVGRAIVKLQSIKGSDEETEILKKIRTVLDSNSPTKITLIQNILGVPEASAPPAVPAVANKSEPNLEELKRILQEVSAVRKLSYGEKLHILQQLIYTTCGEASLLDPLIDHLGKLLATFSTLKVKNARVVGIEERLAGLLDMLQSEALSMETTKKDGALEIQLDALHAQLKELDSRSNSPTSGAISIMEEKALEKNKRRAAIQEEIVKIKDVIAASNSDNAKKGTLTLALLEEKDLLNALLRILGEEDERIEKIALQFLSEIDAQLANLETTNPSIKSLTTTCNQRAFTYRKLLEEEKVKDAEKNTEEKAALVRKHNETVDTLRSEKDAAISELQRQLDELTRSSRNEVDTLRSAHNSSTSELDRLRAALTAKTEEARNTSAAKNAQADQIRRKEAEMKALAAELEKLRQLVVEKDSQLRNAANLGRRLEETETSRGTNVAERNTRIAELEAQLAAVTANTAERNARIADLDAQLGAATAGRETNTAARNERIATLETQLTELTAGRTANTAERNARIADLDAQLAAETTGRAANITERDTRIAALQTGIATNHKMFDKTIGQLTNQIEEKDRRIAELERLTPRPAVPGADSARLRGYGVARDWAATHSSAALPRNYSRSARAETAHIDRLARGRTPTSAASAGVGSRGGGTRKRKEKKERYTRKLR